MTIQTIKRNDSATLDVENGRLIVRKAFKIGKEYYDVEVFSGGDKYFQANQNVVPSEELRKSIQTIFENTFHAARQAALLDQTRPPIAPERACFIYNPHEGGRVLSFESETPYDIGAFCNGQEGTTISGQIKKLYDDHLCIAIVHSGNKAKPTPPPAPPKKTTPPPAPSSTSPATDAGPASNAAKKLSSKLPKSLPKSKHAQQEEELRRKKAEQMEKSLLKKFEVPVHLNK